MSKPELLDKSFTLKELRQLLGGQDGLSSLLSLSPTAVNRRIQGVIQIKDYEFLKMRTAAGEIGRKLIKFEKLGHWQ